MVIITDGNGNIQSPTIPENVYQGSNLANEVVFLAPLPQTNQVTITFNLPNGLVTKQHFMTPYSSVPSEYDLSGWVFRLTKDITAFSGRVNFQIKVYSATNYENVDDSTQIMASCQGSFNVQKGVVSLPSGEPDEDTFEEILTYLSTLTDMVTSQLMPYDENFSYKKDGMTQKDGKFYISKVNNNQGNSLSNTTYWEEIDITSMINTAIAGKQDTLVSGTNIKTINGQSVLGSGNLDINGLFYCTINTTTFSEITTAINAGKLPICIYNDKVYKLSDIGSSSYYFNNIDLTDIRRLSVTSSNSWNLVGIDVENSARKVTSLSSSSTDVQYPSAKLLYDQLQLKQNALSSVQLDAVNSGIDSTKVGQIATNTSDISTINLKIPSTATSSNKMTVRNEVVGSIDMSINSSTYVITIQCKDVDGNNIGTAQTIDLPLESVVVNGSYDSTNKKVILTLENGNTIEFSVADLVSGLQTEITSSNKLDSDLVDDTNQLHKFVTSSEKSQITTNQNNITGLQTSKQDVIDASHKLSADYISNGTNNKVFTATEQTKLSGIEAGAEVNDITDVKVNNSSVVTNKVANIDLSGYVQSASLASVATSGSYTDLSNKPTIPTIVANPTLAGTESDLTGLEVDGTKYKVPTGGSAGVSSLGGATGAITLGSGLAINNNELRVTGSGGSGSLVIDTLWTNPNPSSNFVAQTVTPENLADYDLILIRYCSSITQQSDNESWNCLLRRGCRDTLNAMFWDDNVTPKSFVSRFRTAVFYNTNTIVFGDAAWGIVGNNKDINNSLAIPVQIYGIK